MSSTYKYLTAYFAMNETSYPYKAYRQTCAYQSTKGFMKVLGYKTVPANNPTALLNAVAQQPVAIALNAASSVFQYYRSGILSSTTCGTTLNHAVILIGYGTSNGVDFWLVKNSWGTGWGESGYVRILRNMTALNSGICGLQNSLNVYPYY